MSMWSKMQKENKNRPVAPIKLANEEPPFDKEWDSMPNVGAEVLPEYKEESKRGEEADERKD